ncbi:MAG TPA: PHP domain-containing protein [Phycisphaerales bacterium]|nr:PHP domain-containing protein [Phycisphaerales bacterium]
MPETPIHKIRPHPAKNPESLGSAVTYASGPRYAELQVASNFSFLRGASHPDELVAQAAAMGCSGIAITDINTLAGVVRAHIAAKEVGIGFAVGSWIVLGDTERGKALESEGGSGEVAEWQSGKVKEEDWSSKSSLCHSATLPLSHFLLYPTDRASYGRLCRLLTRGKRKAIKGHCRLELDDVREFSEGLLCIAIPPADLEKGGPADGLRRQLATLRGIFDADRLSLATSCIFGPDDHARLELIADVAHDARVPLVATNDVHYHVPYRRALQDVLTCIRHTTTIDRAAHLLFPHAERFIKGAWEMSRLFGRYPQAIDRTMEVFERAREFSLDQLRYEYPQEVCPPGKTPMSYLRELTWKGAMERYKRPPEDRGLIEPGGAWTSEPAGEVGEVRKKTRKKARKGSSSESPSPREGLGWVGEAGDQQQLHVAAAAGEASEEPPRSGGVPSTEDLPVSGVAGLKPFSYIPNDVLLRIEHEFQLIEELGYAKYFLTVYDIVKYARSKGILCQGRGAAANSAVCYCLGVTSVDPDRIDLLFERFVSKERNEPPDIDIDFEHERREEVIQYIYEKYGRDRAALTCEVITYRGRSAVREVGKAMGLSLDCVDRLAKQIDWWQKGPPRDEQIRSQGLDPEDPTIKQVAELTNELLGFPRHISQHVGGFVITQGLLEETVPIENAAMPDRTVVEWDKDDIDAMGMLKVDCLGLGMLTVIKKGFKFLEAGLSAGELVDAARPGSAGTLLSPIGAAFSSPGWSERERAEPGVGFRPNGAPECCHGWSERERAEPVVDAEDIGSPEGATDESATEPESAAPSGLHNLGPGTTGCARSQSRPSLHPWQHSNTPSGRGTALENGRAENPADAPPSGLNLASIPQDDPAVYEMFQHADTVGVFQIESRAQMSMLPRLKPKTFYDLVIEVAIVRPGPIQGNMVHPYLRRRMGLDKWDFPSPEVKDVLGKTLGVPLFQEQAMKLAIVAAGFTPGEADQLRRAIAAWKKRPGQLELFGDRLISGMLRNGYSRQFAEQCYQQIQGFSGYGFPESHAASFALLVYVSGWLKRHHPAAFCAALINSQPMGFYAPAQLVRDAKEHGVEVRPVDVNLSTWDCTLEPKWQSGEVAKWQSENALPSTLPLCHSATSPLSFGLHGPALRLGLRLISGLREDHVNAISAAVKRHGHFKTIHSLWMAAQVPVATLRRLASADAFGSMGLSRRQALWEVRNLRDEHLPLFDAVAAPPLLRSSTPPLDHTDPPPATIPLPQQPPDRAVLQDYAAMGLSLKAHPISFLRDALDGAKAIKNEVLRDTKRTPQGRRVSVAGIVLVRQRPGTASGIVFMTIEDESGIANLIIRPHIFEKFRKAARHSVCVLATGTVERQGEVIHVQVQKLQELSEALKRDVGLSSMSRDFH